ncbi:hypothetical protein GCM10010252_19220 [Streptomyces aureoverticillatus]|nr:hypothetical protein GCM10010252_19220 [Streptomyces aureoverticillatus]
MTEGPDYPMGATPTMGDNNSTDQRQPKKASPPAVGDRPSLRIDEALAADLADVMRVHPTFADAVRQAVGQLALTYRTGWTHKVCPPSVAPVLLAYQLGDPSTMRRTRPVSRRVPSPPPGQQLRPAFAEELLAGPTPPARPDAERPARA